MSRHRRRRGPAPRIAAGALACLTAIAGCTWLNPILYENHHTKPAAPARLITVTVSTDDGTRRVHIPAGTTVETALNAAHTTAWDRDLVTPRAGTRLHADTTVTVTRATWAVGTAATAIPRGLRREETPTLPAGVERVQAAGRDGSGETTVLSLTVGGETVESTPLTRHVTTPMEDTVILVGVGVAPTPKNAMQQWAHDTLLARGYSEADWTATDYIISHESGWRVDAGRVTGAYGLPQANPGAKMASVGEAWATDYRVQLEWFWNYCERRYGSITGAYEHWLVYGNY